MALGSTQPLIEMITRNLPAVNERPVLGADKLTALCEPIVRKYEPRRLKTLSASTACYRDRFLSFLPLLYLATLAQINTFHSTELIMKGSGGGDSELRVDNTKQD
jgi:hypothetical protein